MKKNVLQIFSFLALIILSAGISIQAQTLGSYRAQIPFDFIVGNKTYEAGEYKVRLDSPNNLATILSVARKNGNDLQRSVVMSNGDRSKNQKTSLLFDYIGDHYVLSEIVAPNFGFNAPKSKNKKRLAKNSGKATETIAIALIRQEKDT